MPAILHRSTGLALVGVTLLGPIVSQLHAESLLSKLGRKCKPEACYTVDSLAKEMDWLEHFIDSHGTITAKAPDIWGEQRLIKHRQEFERQLSAEIGSFEAKMNAAVARSDQAFLSSATALSFAISGRQAGYTAPPTGQTAITPPDVTVQANIDVPSAVLQPKADGTGFELANPTKADSSVIFRKPAVAQTQPLLGFDGKTISLEPTVVIDQQKRFIDHLHALRRLNEGDDISDTPCYSLNLVRIPISVLPGKDTRKGHGAEITITAEPVLSDQLLPTTMRRLIVNEVQEVFSVIIRDELEDGECGLDPADGNCINGKSNSAQIRLASGTSDEAQISPESVPTDDNGGIETSEPPDLRKYALHASQGAPSLVAYSEFDEIFVQADFEGITSAVSKTLEVTDREHDIILDIRVGLAAEADGAYEMLMRNAMTSLWESSRVLGLAEAIRTGCEEEIQRYRKQFFDDLTAACCDPHVVAAGRRPQRPGDHVAWAVYVSSVLANDRLIRDMREMGPALKCPECNPEGMIFVGPQAGPEAAQVFNEYVKCRWPIRVFALDPVVDEQNVADAFSRRRELQLAMALKFASGRMSANNLTKFVRRLEWDMNVIALNRTAIGFNHDSDTFGWRFYPRVQTPPVKGNIGTFVETWVGGPTSDQDMNKRQIEPGQRECIAIVLMPAFVPYVRFDTRSNWFKLTNPKATEVTIQDAMQMSQSIRRMTNVSQGVVDADNYREGEIERLQRRVDQLSKELPLQTLHAQTPIDVDVTAAEAFATGVEELTPAVYGAYGEPGVVLGVPTTLFVVGRNFSVHDTQVIAGNVECRFELMSRHIMKVTIPPDARPVEHKDCEHSEIELCSCSEQHIDLHVATPYGVSKHLKVPVVLTGVNAGVPKFEWRPAEYIVETGYNVAATDGAISLPAGGLKPFSPGRLTIPFPSGYIDPNGAQLTIRLLTPEGEPLGTVAAKALKRDESRQYYLEIADIESDIRTALQTYITSRGATQAAQFLNDLKLVGSVTVSGTVSVPISGEAFIRVNYRKIN